MFFFSSTVVPVRFAAKVYTIYMLYIWQNNIYTAIADNFDTRVVLIQSLMGTDGT